MRNPVEIENSEELRRLSGSSFLAKLANRPTSTHLSNLRAGSSIAFTAAPIHSLAKGQPTHEQ
jgi:hypothetical protein